MPLSLKKFENDQAVLTANLLLADTMIEAGKEPVFYEKLHQAFEEFLPVCELQVFYIRQDWDTIRCVYEHPGSVDSEQIRIASPESLLAKAIGQGEIVARFAQDQGGLVNGEKVSAWIGLPIHRHGLVSIVMVFKSSSGSESPLTKENYHFLCKLIGPLERYINAHLERVELWHVEQKYQDILHNSPDVFFQLTPSGSFEFLSPNIIELLGYEAEALMGKHIKQTTPMGEMGELLKQIYLVKQDRVRGYCRLKQMHLDGHEIDVEIHLAPMIVGDHVVGIHGVYRDVSAQVKMHDENRHLASYPQANPQPVLELSLKGDLIFQNMASKNLLAWLILGQDDYAEILPDNYMNITAEMLSEDEDTRRITKDLGDRFLQWTMTIPATRESIIFYAADITSMHQTEIALTHAKDKAEQGERVKDAFIDNISHEIRTPLNSLLGFIKVLEEEISPSLSDEQIGYFDIIRMSGHRISRSMKAILEISQLEAGHAQHALERIDVYELIMDLIAPYEANIAAKGLTLTVDAMPQRGLLEKDRGYLKNALVQILENAITFTTSGSITIRHTEDEQYATISVQDTGEGMAGDLVDYIVQPFTQGSEGFSKRFQGLGLGLALVKRYAQVLDADLHLESTPGVGTTFSLRLERLKETAEIGHDHDIRVPKFQITGRRSRILIVEDDAITQKLYEVNLHNLFDLYFAFNLSQAKKYIRKHHVDAIILDLNLQDGEQGEDLLDYLVEHGHGKTPILIASSDPEKVNLQTHQDITLAGILAKPFDYAKMIRIIGELTGDEN